MAGDREERRLAAAKKALKERNTAHLLFLVYTELRALRSDWASSPPDFTETERGREERRERREGERKEPNQEEPISSESPSNGSTRGGGATRPGTEKHAGSDGKSKAADSRRAEAEEVLEIFNQAWGTKHASEVWINRIIRRWPKDWRVSDWGVAIAGMFGSPRYWEPQRPHPGHLLGKDGGMLVAYHEAQEAKRGGQPAVRMTTRHPDVVRTELAMLREWERTTGGTHPNISALETELKEAERAARE